MKESYETYRFRYVDGKGGSLTVLARDRKTADRIADADSLGREAPWRPRRWPFFVKKVRVFIPPYELENAQLEAAENYAKRRLSK